LLIALAGEWLDNDNAVVPLGSAVLESPHAEPLAGAIDQEGFKLSLLS
jgi:hypothetical protein